MSQEIFITGTSSGLGKITAKLFAGKGWKVIAAMCDPDNEIELLQFEIKCRKIRYLENYSIYISPITKAPFSLTTWLPHCVIAFKMGTKLFPKSVKL